MPILWNNFNSLIYKIESKIVTTDCIAHKLQFFLNFFIVVVSVKHSYVKYHPRKVQNLVSIILMENWLNL